MKKKIFIFIITIIIVIIAYNYVYQDHRNIEKEKAEFVVLATEISNEFLDNPEQASTKYLNKTIEVTGVVTNINDNDLTLDINVFCQFVANIEDEISVGDKIKVKGRCIGFDDLLTELKLDQCTIIE
ncbi:MAG TPA: hypothetical protein VKN14_12030 [Flavobacteriaceae bacterium]|nr:hypothetical protein [Flavobacteriaceae bacterium]